MDVAVRLGPLNDSSLIAVRLGAMQRYLCAGRGYVDRRGAPGSIDELKDHDVVEMPGSDGRPRAWTFSQEGRQIQVALHPRMTVNEALTVHRLVVSGVGLGVISGYLCGPDIATGRLVRLLPEWSLPPVEVSLVFPSRRELSPAVRAFAEFMLSHWLPSARRIGDANRGRTVEFGGEMRDETAMICLQQLRCAAQMALQARCNRPLFYGH